MKKIQFQSTLPTRGSDIPSLHGCQCQSYHFNPRSPRGGATGKATNVVTEPELFQSTLPTRGSDSPCR